jgi:hypothetical protein
LQYPPGLRKTKAMFLKLKVAKFCILDNSLYWKDPGGILLNCFLEEDMKHAIKDFHKGDCGGHHYRETTTQKYRGKDFIGPLFLQMYARNFPIATNVRYSMEKKSCNLCH